MKSSLVAFSIILLVILSANTFSQNLVAHYPFDGNAIDQSGNLNNGTVYGATLTADRFGHPNAAYFFDGVNGYIEVSKPNRLELTSWTISGWIKANEFALLVAIIGKHENSQHKYNYFVGMNSYSPPLLTCPL